MQIDNQRLRNLTTGRLHTEMGHIYEDLEFLTGIEGLMTHQLPAINNSVQEHLKSQLADERFWNDKYDTEHTGTTNIEPMGA